MDNHNRIYLDNAATSWPKPESVYSAVDRYMRENGVSAGRTTGLQVDEVSGLLSRLRKKMLQFVAATGSEVVFCQNGTEALNIAIHGTLNPGDHVVTTQAEHNSVLRPLRYLEDHGVITVTRVECGPLGEVDFNRLLDEIRPETKLLALIHCSNVTGWCNDVREIGRQIESSPVRYLVDAAQSLGSSELAFDDSGIDFLCAPGHKGLLGPLGTGALWISQKGQQGLRPLKQGGTGASSDSDRQPTNFPEAFEVGNLNIPGLVGLDAGLDFVNQEGIEAIRLHKHALSKMFVDRVSDTKGIQLYVADGNYDSGIVAFNLPIAPAELAAILDSSFGIQIRAGYHCASLIHQNMNNPSGCARISFGYFNTPEDVESAATAIHAIADAL